MLSLSLNSKSTQVEEIEKLGFTELYENIAEVYDFFDAEYSRTGNMDKVSELIKYKFNNKVIYENSFIKVSIHTLYVKNEKLESYLVVNTEHTNAIKFWENYLEGIFDMKDEENDGFISINGKFNVVDIEEEIKKRLSIIKDYLAFADDWYEFSQSDNFLKKQLKVWQEKKLWVFSTTKSNNVFYKKLDTIATYIEKKLASKWETNTNMSLPNVKIGNATVVLLEYFAALSLWVRNMKFEEAQELYAEINDYVDTIDEILKQKTKVSKIVKGCKEKLYTTLTTIKTQDRKSIRSDFGKILREYKSLQEKGEILYSPKVIDFLEDMVEVLNNMPTSENYDYIEKNYNEILDNIAEEKPSKFIIYYKQRLDNRDEGNDPYSLDFQSIIMKLEKFEEKDLMYINAFKESVFRENIANISAKQVQIIIDIMGHSKPEFISSLYASLLKYDSTYDVDIDLEKYKYIYDYNSSLSEYEMEVFENILARVIFQRMVANPTYINDLDRLIKDEGLEDYILDVSNFETKYLTKIYDKVYKYRILDDKKLIGQQDINFSLYSCMTKDNIEEFVSYILVPHIVYKLHMEDDSELVDKCILALQKWLFMEVLLYLEYDDTTYKLLNNNLEEEYCKQILKYWYLISKKEKLEDYTIDGLEVLFKETYGAEAIADPDFVDSLMEDERNAFNFLETNLTFPTEIWTKLANHRSIDVRKKLAVGPHIDGEEVIALLCGEEEQKEEVVMAFLEVHESFPNDVWISLAHHSSIEVKKKLLSLKGLTEEEKEAFCYLEQDEEILLMLLETGTTISIDRFISKHPSVKVRRRIALFGEKLDIEIQKILAVDEEEEVVLNLLQPGLSFETDKLIAKHPSVRVRKELALFGGKLNIEVQKMLAKDEEEVVLNLLKLWLEDEVDILMAKNPSVRVRKELAKYGGRLNVEIQKVLAVDEEEVVLNLLQLGLKTETDMLIAKHPSVRIRKKIASFGIRLDEKVIDVLSKDEDEEVLFMVKIFTQ